MKPYFISFFLCLLFTSCSKTLPPEEMISHLNGYWEIERVVLHDGTKKEYPFSQHIDFIEVHHNREGVRKKVHPQLDGSFLTTPNTSYFTLKIEHDSLRMYYKSDLDTWKETLILAKENQLILKNDTGNLYFYKSYQKIDL